MTTDELYNADLGESPREEKTFTIPKASAPGFEIGASFEVAGEEEGAWIIRPLTDKEPDAAEPPDSPPGEY